MSRIDTFIIDAVRTPIGKFGGSLSSIRTDDLAAHVIQKLLSRQQFDSSEIELIVSLITPGRTPKSVLGVRSLFP